MRAPQHQLPCELYRVVNRNEKQRVDSNNERLANSTWLSNSLRRDRSRPVRLNKNKYTITKDRSRPVPTIGLVHRRRGLVNRDDKEKKRETYF